MLTKQLDRAILVTSLSFQTIKSRRGQAPSIQNLVSVGKSRPLGPSHICNPQNAIAYLVSSIQYLLIPSPEWTITRMCTHWLVDA